MKKTLKATKKATKKETKKGKVNVLKVNKKMKGKQSKKAKLAKLSREHKDREAVQNDGWEEEMVVEEEEEEEEEEGEEEAVEVDSIGYAAGGEEYEEEQEEEGEWEEGEGEEEIEADFDEGVQGKPPPAIPQQVELVGGEADQLATPFSSQFDPSSFKDSRVAGRELFKMIISPFPLERFYK